MTSSWCHWWCHWCQNFSFYCLQLIDEPEFNTGDHHSPINALHQWRMRLNSSSDYLLELAEHLSLDHLQAAGGGRNPTSIQQWANQRAVLVPKRRCLITPCRPPPSAQKAMEWLRKQKDDKGRTQAKSSSAESKKQKEEEDPHCMLAIEEESVDMEDTSVMPKDQETHQDRLSPQRGQRQSADSPVPETPMLLHTPSSPRTPSAHAGGDVAFDFNIKPAAHSTPAPADLRSSSSQTSPLKKSTPPPSRRSTRFALFKVLPCHNGINIFLKGLFLSDCALIFLWSSDPFGKTCRCWRTFSSSCALLQKWC